MEKMKKKMMQLWKDEEGATMVEYGIMVALIAAVAIAVVTDAWEDRLKMLSTM